MGPPWVPKGPWVPRGPWALRGPWVPWGPWVPKGPWGPKGSIPRQVHARCTPIARQLRVSQSKKESKISKCIWNTSEYMRLNVNTWILTWTQAADLKFGRFVFFCILDSILKAMGRKKRPTFKNSIFAENWWKCVFGTSGLVSPVSWILWALRSGREKSKLEHVFPCRFRPNRNKHSPLRFMLIGTTHFDSGKIGTITWTVCSD